MESYRVPDVYTGCLAHVEVVEQASNGEITRISGILEHNQGCHEAVLSDYQPIPLHH
jgi:hypothetical protein